MTKQAKPAVSHEFAEHMLRDWAENLWTLNNKDKITDDDSRRKVEREFINKMHPDNNRGLSKGESASEQSFTTVIIGLVHTVGRVSNRALDAVSDTKLVDAWRKSVLRNSFRQRYQAIEEIIADSIARNGANATLDQFPKLNTSSHAEIAAAIDYMNYEAKHLPAGTVANLVRSAGNAQKPQPRPAAPGTP